MRAQLGNRTIRLCTNEHPTSHLFRSVVLRRASTTSNPAYAVSRSTQRSSKPLPKPLYKDQSLRNADYVRELAGEGATVPIYKAPQARGHFLSIYGLSAFCLGYSAVLAHDYVFANLPGVQAWAQYTFAIPVLFLSAFGTFVLLKSVNSIRLIEAVPGPDGIKVHVHIRRAIPVPFRCDRLVVVNPGDIVVDQNLVAPPLEHASVETRESNLLSRFFNFQINILHGLFIGSRRIFTSEGFAKVNIGNYRADFKLDMRGNLTTNRRLLNSVLKFGP